MPHRRLDCGARDTRRPADPRDATVAQGASLSGEEKTSLSLIEQRKDSAELPFEFLIGKHASIIGKDRKLEKLFRSANLPGVAAIGSSLVAVMSVVTLSFLITTPECWVPSLGGPEHGFPLLSGAGRLVVKDAIMIGAAIVTMADSAKAYLRNRIVAGRAVPIGDRAGDNQSSKPALQGA